MAADVRYQLLRDDTNLLTETGCQTRKGHR